MQLAEEGIIVKPLKEMPDLFEDLSTSWEAFWTLSMSRPLGFNGAGPIPFSEISSYLIFRNIKDYDIQDEIVKNVQFLDIQFLEDRNKEQPVKKDGN